MRRAMAAAALLAVSACGTGPAVIDADIGGFVGTGQVGDYGDFTGRLPGFDHPIYIPRCTPPDGAQVLDFDTDPPMRELDLSGHPEILDINGRVFEPTTGTLTPSHAMSTNVNDVITFNRGQRHVGFHIGRVSGSGLVELVGKDDHGRIVVRDVVTSLSTAANTCMAVRSRRANIFSVALYVDGEEISFDGLFYDHLFFSSTVEMPTPPSPVVGTLAISTPEDRQTVSTSLAHPVAGTVRAPAGMVLSEVTISVPRWDGSSTETHSASLFKLRRDGDEDVFFFAASRIYVPPGWSWIGATAVGPGFRASAGVEVFGRGNPALDESDLPGNIDIEPVTIEVTQAIRGPVDLIPPGGEIDERRDTILVHDKRTVARGFARYTFPEMVPGTAPAVRVAARLFGTRDGAALPESPLLPFGEVRAPIYPHRSRDDAYHRGKQQTNLSWNFRLPLSWTSEGGIDLRLEVNPVAVPPAIEEYPGTGGDLNSITLHNVRFRPQQQPSVKLWSVDYWWRCPFTGSLGVVNPGKDPGTLCAMLPTGTEITHVQPADLEVLRAVRSWWNMSPFPGTWPRSLGIFDYVFASAGDPPEPHLEAGSTIDQFLLGSAWRCLLVSNHDYSRFNALVNSFCRGCANAIPSVFKATATSDGTVLAHEAGHTMGLRHTKSHGAAFAVTRWRGDHGQISIDAESSSAFNVSMMQALPYVLPGRRGENSERHDIMAYPGPNNDARERWPSWEVWHHMEDVVGSNLVRIDNRVDNQYYGGAPADQTPGSITVSGVIDGADVKLRPGFVGGGGIIGDGDLLIEAHNAAGKVVARAKTQTLVPYDADDVTVRTFSTPLRVKGNAREVVIYLDGKEIHRAGIAPAPWMVVLRTRRRWPDKGVVRIRWHVWGRKKGATYLVQASKDGQEWQQLATTKDTRISIDAETVPFEGRNWILRVQASSGLDVALSEPVPVNFPVKPLRPTIVNPLEGDVINNHDVIELRAILPEFAAGDPSSLEWWMDGKLIAAGLTAPTFIAKPGEYRVMLREPKSGYETASSFTVVEDSDADGLPDPWERQYGLNPYDSADSQSDLDQDGRMAWEEFQLGTDPSVHDNDWNGVSEGAAPEQKTGSIQGTAQE